VWCVRCGGAHQGVLALVDVGKQGWLHHDARRWRCVRFRLPHNPSHCCRRRCRCWHTPLPHPHVHTDVAAVCAAERGEHGHGVL
jgi:hypothetical protein